MNIPPPFMNCKYIESYNNPMGTTEKFLGKKINKEDDEEMYLIQKNSFNFNDYYNQMMQQYMNNDGMFNSNVTINNPTQNQIVIINQMPPEGDLKNRFMNYFHNFVNFPDFKGGNKNIENEENYSKEKDEDFIKKEIKNRELKERLKSFNNDSSLIDSIIYNLNPDKYNEKQKSKEKPKKTVKKKPIKTGMNNFFTTIKPNKSPESPKKIVFGINKEN